MLDMNVVKGFEARIELQEELLRQIRIEFKETIKYEVTSLICAHTAAEVIRVQADTDIHHDLLIWFDLGFWNDAESRIDFGSDFTCCINSTDRKIQINYGTIGYFTTEDKYQVARIKTLSHILTNIDLIEARLSSIIDKYMYLKEEEHKLYMITSEYNMLKQKDKEATRKVVEEKLKPGVIITGSTAPTAVHDEWRVTGVGKVYVTITDNVYTSRMKKTTLVDNIIEGITIIKE